ncbi:MAG: hypothetical protein PHF56_18675 [Desulfuromonadaceae bacterium]|nr:hypothetical protein [Desulfuromonadaceae bacterium]
MASSLPAEILSENGLPTDEAMDAVEVAIARTLTGTLRSNVCVKIGAQLEIIAYPSGNGEPIKISLDAINGKLRRHLLYQIRLELQKRRTLNEADRLKELRGYSAPGEISRIADDGALIVSLEIADYYRRLILCGICPARFQPFHELGHYSIGSVKEFYISSVVPVMVNKRYSKVRILLSRTSKELPRLLLQERSRIAGIRCIERVPGAYSSIVTPGRIPKEIINSVGKELEEHLHVSIQEAHQ